MRAMLSTTERLAAELAEATGDTCGHNCDHHVHVIPDDEAEAYQHRLRCVRAADHLGATLLVDQHVGRMPDGTLVTFGEHCCAEMTP